MNKRKEIRIVMSEEKANEIKPFLDKIKQKHKHTTDAQATLAIIELYKDIVDNDTQHS